MAINSTIGLVHVHVGALDPGKPREVWGLSENLNNLLVEHDAGFFIRVRSMSCYPCAGYRCEQEGCPTSHRCHVCKEPGSYTSPEGEPWACAEHSTHFRCSHCDGTHPKAEMTVTNPDDPYYRQQLCASCADTQTLRDAGLSENVVGELFCQWPAQTPQINGLCGSPARWYDRNRSAYLCRLHANESAALLLAAGEAYAPVAADDDALPFD